MKKETRLKRPSSLRLLRFAFSRLGPLLPAYFSKLACELWFTTHRFKRPQKENNAAKNANRSITAVKNTDITVWSWGQGQPVLFIHGWNGRGTQAVPFIEPLTKAGYRIISFDGPAHGETPGKQTSMLEMTDVILALSQIYGPFHSTITHSFGGMVLAYASTRGFTTGSAVCICPPAGIDTILDKFRQSFNLPDNVFAAMTARLYKSYGDDLDRRVSTLNNVCSMSIPALIIHDEKDPDIPWQDGEAIANAWPGAEFRLTQGLGHRRILRDPTTVAAVTDFITNR